MRGCYIPSRWKNGVPFGDEPSLVPAKAGDGFVVRDEGRLPGSEKLPGGDKMVKYTGYLMRVIRGQDPGWDFETGGGAVLRVPAQAEL